MTYGKDYGMKADVPWYIKCPIVNWFFKTCKVEVSLTTFSDDGGPLIGVNGTFRIPYKDKGKCISSILRVRYCYPNENLDLGHGIYARITLIDVNHRKVYESGYAKGRVTNGYEAKSKKSMIWFGEWKKEILDVTFNKDQYKRKGKK